MHSDKHIPFSAVIHKVKIPSGITSKFVQYCSATQKHLRINQLDVRNEVEIPNLVTVQKLFIDLPGVMLGRAFLTLVLALML